MNIFSKEKTIISDIINRLMNCRSLDNLYVYGSTCGELDYLYPAINIMQVAKYDDIKGNIVYLHISDAYDMETILPWVRENSVEKDFIIYVSSEIEVTDENREILGNPHYLERYSGLVGMLFLKGISFLRPEKLMIPADFKVLAIVHFYNEADIMDKTIQYLLNQELDVYLLDNWSDDGSFDIARKYKELYPDRVHLEQFPASGRSGNYEWYNQLARTEVLSREMDYDWFIHYDMDEMRLSPWENITLKEAIFWIDQQGYNCIENTVIDFRLTKQDIEDNIFMKDTFFDFRHSKIWIDQLKTWKKSDDIELKSSGGHFAHRTNPKIYPLKFLNRHYPLRSIEQAEKKVFKDRLPRFTKERQERGWHGHYDAFKGLEDFIYDEAQLIPWNGDIYTELYIPFFMECGLRWDVEGNASQLNLHGLENKKLVIYGAGNVGRQVYLELVLKNDIIGWVDSSYQKSPAIFCEHILPVKACTNLEFDYIIVSVKNKKVQEEICSNLLSRGIQMSKIMFAC